MVDHSADKGPDLAIVLLSAGGGGAERVSILLANEFARRGRSVAILMLRRRGPLLGMIDPRVQVHDLGGRRTIWSIRRLAATIRRLKPKTIIAAMVEVNVGTAIAARLAGTRAKLILTEHNQTDRNFDVASTLSVRLAFRLIRFVYPLADRVVCVSQGVADSLMRFSGLPPAKIDVIHNPIVSSDLLDKAAMECPHPWLSDKTVPVVLAAGRLVTAKDFEMLLHAFARIRKARDCRLIILGEGEKRKVLQNLCETLGVAEDVEITGFVSNPYTYMQRCDVFALSSAWEGFPTVLVEALACGAKIVSTDCPSGPREILCDGKFGSLTPVGDPDRFAAAIIEVLDNPVSCGALARGQGFTVEKSTDQYDILIKDLENRAA